MTTRRTQTTNRHHHHTTHTINNNNLSTPPNPLTTITRTIRHKTLTRMRTTPQRLRQRHRRHLRLVIHTITIQVPHRKRLTNTLPLQHRRQRHKDLIIIKHKRLFITTDPRRHSNCFRFRRRDPRMTFSTSPTSIQARRVRVDHSMRMRIRLHQRRPRRRKRHRRKIPTLATITYCGKRQRGIRTTLPILASTTRPHRARRTITTITIITI